VALRIIFVADFGHDFIEVSTKLPNPRPLACLPSTSIPCFRGFNLTRLRINASKRLVLPHRDFDFTREEYHDWRSILDPDSVTEQETVDPTLVYLGFGGICVDLQLEAVDNEKYGPTLLATVTNVGPYTSGNVQVFWHRRWEHKGDSSLIGRGFQFLDVGAVPQNLRPGKSRRFALLGRDLKKAMSYATAAFPSEQFYVGVNVSLPGQTAAHEIYSRPGVKMRHIVENLETLLGVKEARS
jgi:hypothetical protein